MAAIDRDAYNKAATGGAAEVASSTMSKSNKCYDPETSTLVPTGGPAAAKNLLLNAGYTDGAGGFFEKNGKQLAITLLSSNAFAVGSGPEYIVNQWIAAGVNAKLSSPDLAAYNTHLRGLTYDTVIIASGSQGGRRTRAAHPVQPGEH